MHKLGIIHNDVKLQNVLIGRDGHCRITDFGSAEILKRKKSDDRLTAEHMDGYGRTAFYMAPELFSTHVHDETVDIWSLGTLMYDLAMGLVSPRTHHCVASHSRHVIQSMEDGNMGWAEFTHRVLQEITEPLEPDQDHQERREFAHLVLKVSLTGPPACKRWKRPLPDA